MKTTFVRKGIFFFVITLVLFSVTSCEKDADKLLEGTWTVESVSADVLINNVSAYDYLTITLGLSETQANATKAMIDSYFEMEGTIEFKSDGTTLIEMEGEDSEEGTWELSSDDKKLTLDAGTDDEVTMDIVSLTKKECEVKWDLTESIDFNQDNIAETMTAEVVLKLSK